MKQNYSIEIKLSEDLLKKILFVADAENRSPAAQFAFMVRNNVAYYEKTKGRISANDLAKIDISEYKQDEQ